MGERKYDRLTIGDRLCAVAPRKGLMSRARAYLSECRVSAVRKRQLEIPIRRPSFE